jgi:hypothetical protein
MDVPTNAIREYLVFLWQTVSGVPSVFVFKMEEMEDYEWADARRMTNFVPPIHLMILSIPEFRAPKKEPPE